MCFTRTRSPVRSRAETQIIFFAIFSDEENLNEEQNCLKQRENALKTSNQTGIPVFVPVCQDDGSYVEVQCFYGTGYCWCVNEEGNPVPGTSIKYQRPKCRKKAKRSRRVGKKPKNLGKLGKGACIQADRSEFNTQVSDIIMSEFRQFNQGQIKQGSVNHRREMIEWKFDQMDTNK